MSSCATCGRENPGEARYCLECGHLLAAPVQDERKVVTVLFADLVGFTSRSEQMDVEDVRSTLVRYHDLVRRELERFGGTVEKFIGDAVVAMFGAPVAHEDDPERAVLAALAIQAAMAHLRDTVPQLDLHVRIGVNTGEALVSLGANPLAGEGVAHGDVVNTAARLQAAAAVDGVLVGEVTFRATGRVVEYEPADDLRVKGKRVSLKVWSARAARPADTDPRSPHATPLVGRDSQLDALWSALAHVREHRSPQLVTVAGVPGIGKSRLVFELLRRAEQDGAPITRLKGRSLPYGEGVTFWALAEVVRSAAGILHSDGMDSAAGKLHQAVASRFTDAREATWVEAQLRPLLGVEQRGEPAEDRQVEAFAAWRRFLESLAAQHPLVLVFEDLHWADDALLDFVHHLVEWMAAVPVLVLCTARPELLDRRPGWGSATDALTISLPPLSERDTATLIAALLDQVALPAETQTALLSRAEGNPLYAQEYVRMLLDRGYLVRRGRRWSLAGSGELPLPESVHGIIAARLDALAPEDKALVQDAAVIGKVVWVGAVARVAGRGRWDVEQQLDRLQQREFVRVEPDSSVDGETQFTFQHALIRDVAYAQVVRSARAEKHTRVAAWIESLGDERGDWIELLAHHYLTALDLYTAAGSNTGELPAQARAALLEAADRALALNAFAAAARFYTSAFTLYPEGTAAPPLLRYRYARARMFSEDVLPPDLDQVAGELAAGGDLESAAEAESEIGIWLDQHGDKAAALAHLTRAVDLLAPESMSPAKAGVLSSLASVYVLQGRLDDAIQTAGDAGVIASELGLDDLRAWSHQTLALAWLQQQDVRAIAEFERAATIARTLESYDGAMIEHNYGICLLALGDLAGAGKAQTDAKRRAARLGLTYITQLVDAAQGCLLYHSGDWEGAARAADRMIAQADEDASHGDAVEAHTLRARIDAARGDQAAATRHATEAVRLAREIGEPQYFVSALGVAAHLSVVNGRLDAAAELVDELLSRWWMGVAISSEALMSAAFAASSIPAMRNRFAAAAGDFALPSRWVEAAEVVAEGDFERAADLYAGIGSLPDEAYARQRTGSAAQVERSLGFWHSVGATAHVAAAERSLRAGGGAGARMRQSPPG